jgi:hypothetical protein
MKVKSGVVREFPVAIPSKDYLIIKTPTIETTGLGNQLCYDYFLGRIFYDDELHLRKCVKEFIDEYHASCRRLDEDPAHECYDVTNYNDLYKKIGIETTIVGDQFGWTNTDDYRVNLRISFVMVDSGSMYEKYGNQKILFFGPEDDCLPDQCYMEEE